MSFREKVYPFRTDRWGFTAALLKHVLSDWSEVVDLGNANERPGFMGARCEVVGCGTQCNYYPTFLDRRRVLALLNGWSGRTNSDSYLDLQLVKQFEGQQYMNSAVLVMAAISRAASAGGAVSRIKFELENERTNHVPTFFGDRMYASYDYNTYYTSLLYWDDVHCYGLIRHLEIQEQTHHGVNGSVIHPVWQAARDWLRLHQNEGVYREHQLQVT